LLSGLAFVLFYSILGVPIASLADRSNRRNIIAIGFAFWSLMTALTAFTFNFWTLAITRFLMGAGEACALAPSQSMLADMFTKAKRPAVLAVFTSAFALDGLFLFPLLGWVADHWGWRVAYLAAGLPGVAFAALFVLTVREPVRGGIDAQAASQQKPASMREAVTFLMGARSFAWMLLGGVFMGGVLYSAGAWSNTFIIRVHHWSITETAVTLGPLRGVLGTLGIVGGGFLAAGLAKFDERWRLWTPALFCLLLAPSYALFVLADPTWAWITGVALTALLLVSYQGPTYSVLLNIAQPRMRAVAVSVFVLFTGLFAQICGPLVVGMLNDYLEPTYGDLAIRYSMLIVPICSIGGALSFFAASFSLKADTQRATDASA
jgi:MFS family permease